MSGRLQMNIFKGLEKIVKNNYPIGRDTWYGLGGPADYFIQPQSINELQDVIKRCRDNNVPIKIIGLGSNLLISDEGVRAAVIRLDSEAFSQMEFDGEIVRAGAGLELSRLVLKCVQRGLSGLEALTGIPGSVGGAVKMNAGGNFGDIGSVVQSVTVMDGRGRIFDKGKPELVFDYRKTNITAGFILGCQMKLTKSDSNQIMQRVKEIWIYKKNNQPLNTRNAGCIFKNPAGAAAGALIDKAGLKGTRIGKAVVSEKHADFIIAEQGCKSKDVMQLIDLVRKTVKEKYGIELELEIEIWK
jgi:UDP-N-acetylmuramate dehydrogenase